MKHTFLAALFIFTVGQIGHLGIPWWSLAVIAFVAGWLTQSSWQALLGGFSGGGLLWWLAAWLQDNANESALAGKVGQLFQGLSSVHLLLATGLLGGLIAAFGALTGKYSKDILTKPARRSYLQEKRRR